MSASALLLLEHDFEERAALQPAAHHRRRSVTVTGT